MSSVCDQKLAVSVFYQDLVRVRTYSVLLSMYYSIQDTTPIVCMGMYLIQVAIIPFFCETVALFLVVLSLLLSAFALIVVVVLVVLVEEKAARRRPQATLVVLSLLGFGGEEGGGGSTTVLRRGNPQLFGYSCSTKRASSR